MSDEELKIPEATDAEILFDGVEIAGYRVRPWRLAECVKMTPIIERVQAELKRRKLAFRDFYAKNEKDEVEVVNLDQLIFIIIPQLPEILSITLGDSVDNINNLDQMKMIELLTTVIQQNAEYLKNLFALTTAATRMVGKGV